MALDCAHEWSLPAGALFGNLEAAGSSLELVLKCSVYCTPGPTHFATFNDMYARYFPSESPARIFVHVPSWPGPFDVEVDCVAMIASGA